MYIFWCNFHVCKWKNDYIKDLNALRIKWFFFSNLFRRKKCMHNYVCEHIPSLYYWTAWWMFMKLGKDEVLMPPHLFWHFGQIHQGVDLGRAKNRSWGSPSSKNLFFRPEAKCIAMIQKHMETSVVVFCSIWKSHFDAFLTSFWI